MTSMEFPGFSFTFGASYVDLEIISKPEARKRAGKSGINRQYKSTKTLPIASGPSIHHFNISLELFQSFLSQMYFTSLITAGALFASLTSALPMVARDAGPSGSVVSPAGDTNYPVGAATHFKYQGVSTTETRTSRVEVRLVTFEGKVTYSANNNISVRGRLPSSFRHFTHVIYLARIVHHCPDGSTFIDTWFRIPPLAILPPAPGSPTQDSWVAREFSRLIFLFILLSN